MGGLSDGELLERLDGLARRERRVIAEVVAHLAEVERRKLHLALGYGSMFAYVTERLQYSEQAAYRRISAARVACEHPRVLEDLATGELTLSSLNALGSRPSAELVEQARGKSKREVERLVAETSPDYSRGKLVAMSERGMELLKQARDLDPASDAELLEKALALFVKQRCKQRFAQAEKLRPSSKPQDKLRAATRREVFVRDEGRCSFVGEGGKRCESTHLLEYDHI